MDFVTSSPESRMKEGPSHVSSERALQLEKHTDKWRLKKLMEPTNCSLLTHTTMELNFLRGPTSTKYFKNVIYYSVVIDGFDWCVLSLFWCSQNLAIPATQRPPTILVHHCQWWMRKAPPTKCGHFETKSREWPSEGCFLLGYKDRLLCVAHSSAKARILLMSFETPHRTPLRGAQIESPGRSVYRLGRESHMFLGL